MEEKQVWERQDWESGAAFRAFHDFYLPQEPPRSIDAAWRSWRAGREKKPLTPDPSPCAEDHREKRGEERQRAPGSWRRWSQGRDRDGSELPGAMSWTERAAAWDAHLARVADEAAEARRRKIFSSSYALKEERVLKLQQMLEYLAGPAGIDDLREILDEAKGEIWDPENVWLRDLKMLGSAKFGNAHEVEVFRFNAAIYETVRNLMADIATEMGQRKQAVEINEGKPLQVEDVTDVQTVAEKRWEKVAPLLAKIVARQMASTNGDGDAAGGQPGALADSDDDGSAGNGDA